jgi:hypothetical protein
VDEVDIVTGKKRLPRQKGYTGIREQGPFPVSGVTCSQAAGCQNGAGAIYASVEEFAGNIPEPTMYTDVEYARDAANDAVLSLQAGSPRLGAE